MKSKKKNRNIIIVTSIVIIIIAIVTSSLYIFNKKGNVDLVNNNDNITSIEDVKFHYNKYVITKDDSKLYNEEFMEVGVIGKNVELILEDANIDINTVYFKTVINDKTYYVDYYNLEKIENLSNQNERYKKYIVFNQNIVTHEKTNFYDSNDNLVYSINSSFDLPIVVKYDDKYGVIYDQKLLYIDKKDVKDIVEYENTEEQNSTGIPVLNYHFVYEDDDTTCNEEICHSATQISKHFSYIKDNGFFTPTMEELEMYIDGNIRLPQKSVVITFDDGGRAEVAKKYVDMYQLNATLFMITSWYDKEQFQSEYLEIHSHGHDLHNGGLCAGGQGGEIKCLEKGKLLLDLETSRKELNNTTVFCYPFYEYNEYSIEVLKEAGFTMAFAGERAGGEIKVKVGADKFRLPRWVIVDWTTMDKFISYVNGGS